MSSPLSSEVPPTPAPRIDPGDRRRLVVYPLLILSLLTLFAFLPVLRNGFVRYDDGQYVTENPHVLAGITPASLRWAATAQEPSNWHPLTLASHMLDVELFGLNPKGHHLTSLLLHWAGVLLLFEVLRRMTGAPLRSAAVAALFAVHPTHVESVAWIAERKDVLCGLFWWLTLAAYLRYARRPTAGRYLLVTAAFALAIMAKPMAVTLPFVLLLLDVWPLARWRPDASAWAAARRLVVEKLPWIALAAAACLAALHTQAANVENAKFAPLALRIANVLKSYVAYLGQTLWPARLGVFYPFPRHIPATQAVGDALLLLLLTALALAAVRRAPYLLVGWLWFLGCMVPVIGLVQVGWQGMADRYTYLPSVGLYLAAVWGIADLVAGRPRLRAAATAGLGLALVLLAVQTRQQVRTWSDSLTLFSHALEVAPSYVAHTNVAEELQARGDRRGAAAHYRAALALAPEMPDAYAAYGGALREWGAAAAAVPYLHAALARDPRDERARLTLAMALDDLGATAPAIAELRRVLADHPGSADARRGLAALLAKRRAGGPSAPVAPLVFDSHPTRP